jgi:putative hydrolase of the HAD superfamily
VTLRAVLLDALGVLVRLEPVAPRLARALAVPEADAERAFRAEVDYYLAHHLEGRDPASLLDLRTRCAEVIRAELGLEGPVGEVREALLASVRFAAFPDAAPALRELRRAGVRTAVASNWDCSLPEVLHDAGLAELVDAVATSAGAGAAKPDPAVLVSALGSVGARPEEAVHVGDSVANDVGAARAAGVRPLLVGRGEELDAPPDVPVLASLRELLPTLH